MTDEQVKKGLAECTTLRYQVGGCKHCPYNDDCNNRTQDQLLQDALALINRLEEENKELRALCRKKSNGMKLDEWVKMIVEADCGVKLVDMNAIKEQIRKETIQETYEWLRDNAVYSEEEGFAREFAKAHDIEVD